MTVTDRRKRLAAAKSVNDLEQGDYVRRVGCRKIGFVEEIQNGWAWVVWSNERRDYLPLCVLRKVLPVGHEFDARRK